MFAAIDQIVITDSVAASRVCDLLAVNCYDNAFMESCFGTIKIELPLEDYASDAVATRELGPYVNYYNIERLHSLLGYVTPCEFDTQSLNN